MQSTYTAPKVIKLNANDNVIIALQDFAKGDVVIELAGTALHDDISTGHKIAVCNIAAGASILRYGQIIGSAKIDIRIGEHVHNHNCEMGSHVQDYAFGSASKPLPPINETRYFQGYHRKDGRVGTRNYIGILTSVNCAGSVAQFIADEVEKTDWFQQLKNVDGIVPIAHSSGCGMSPEDDGYQALFRALTGYAQHPNFAAILMVGLGCEVMQIPDLVDHGQLGNDDRIRSIIIQQSGGTRKTVAKGVEIIRELAGKANRFTRQPAPVSELCIGMQCGGSDGLSGISANPALGVASDLLVRHGGTTILSETTEIYGAEHLLTRRAITPTVGKQLIERIHWWENYAEKNGGKMDNNPTPGNKRGGLTTILEKSLGAVAKGGTAPLSAVYQYGEKITQKGFVFMDSPGYDPCAVTGQIASGANMICFTTGRGSVSGFKPVPCIKVSTNDQLFERLGEDMDLNCGDVISKGTILDDKGREFFELFIRVASGELTKSEALGFGRVEFVPWQMGAVM